MCDSNIEPDKSKDGTLELAIKPSCSMETIKAQINIEPQCSGSVKAEPEVGYQTEGIMNLQSQATRWLREAVDGTYDIKPAAARAIYEHEAKDVLEQTMIVFPGHVPMMLEQFPAAPVPACKEKRKQSDPSRSQPQAPTTPYYCDLCNQKFTRQSNLTEHMLRHAGKVYSCDFCTKKFSCLRYLTRHSRIHNGGENAPRKEPRQPKNTDKSYLCTYCNKKFSCKSHLVAHTRIHTGEKPFQCQICSKNFNHKSHLTAHTRIHTGEKPYACRICQKQFRDPSNLAGHMRVHNGQKPFACQFCHEQFTHRSHLKRHERTHNSEKNFACSICGKQLADNSKLKAHMKTHSAVKCYVCNLCNSEFKAANVVEKPYACDACSRHFAQRLKDSRLHNGQARAHDDRSYMLYATVGNQ